MKMFKKAVLAAMIFSSMSSSVLALNISDNIYVVDGIYGNSQNIAGNIKQDITKATNSCGPTSLMFIKNHISIEQYGIQESFTSSKNAAILELKNIYSSLGESYNTTTDLNDLKFYARSWGWAKVNRMSANSSIDDNVEALINDLAIDRPALVVLDSSFIRNPTRGNHNIDHIVIVYAYQRRVDQNGNVAKSPYNDHQNDRIYFYDHYYGRNGYFTRGEIPNAVNLTGFAYLRVSPK